MEIIVETDGLETNVGMALTIEIPCCYSVKLDDGGPCCLIDEVLGTSVIVTFS